MTDPNYLIDDQVWFLDEPNKEFLWFCLTDWIPLIGTCGDEKNDRT